jgi:hypothetical protein
MTGMLSTETGELPYAREGERLKVFSAELIGLLTILSLLPFIEAGSEDETAALGKRFTEERELVHRLGARIDVRHLRLLFHPEWDKSPADHHEFGHREVLGCHIDRTYPWEQTLLKTVFTLC